MYTAMAEGDISRDQDEDPLAADGLQPDQTTRLLFSLLTKTVNILDQDRSGILREKVKVLCFIF